MTIRRACAADAPAIRDIWNRVIRETAITFTDVEKSQADIHAVLEAQPVFVQAGGGAVSGFATYGGFRGGPGYADAAELTIYLEPGATGAGRADALLAALENHAQTSGLVHLVAGIAGSNDRAVRFFARHGYTQTAHMPEIGRKFGARHDLVLMQKKLGNPT